MELSRMIHFEVLEPDAADMGAASQILAYWEQARGDRFAPAWQRDFRLLDLPVDAIPCMTVVDRIRDGKAYFYRFWGTRHAILKGFEMTGKTVEATPNRTIGALAAQQFDAVIRRRRPTVFLYKIDYPARRRLAEFVLRLPLSDDGETVDRIATFQDLISVGRDWQEAVAKIWQMPEQKTAG